MKKIVGFLLLFVIIITSCEKDDFCTQNPVTSKLIITFFDDVNRETRKRAQNFSIWSGTNDTLVRYHKINTDSIVIPLNSLTTETIYHFKKNDVNGDEITTFTIKYDTEEDFVSRSCGFKVIFKNIEFTKDANQNSWITDFTPNTLENLNNQNAAHVQIFH